MNHNNNNRKDKEFTTNTSTNYQTLLIPINNNKYNNVLNKTIINKNLIHIQTNDIHQQFQYFRQLEKQTDYQFTFEMPKLLKEMNQLALEQFRILSAFNYNDAIDINNNNIDNYNNLINNNNLNNELQQEWIEEEKKEQFQKELNELEKEMNERKKSEEEECKFVNLKDNNVLFRQLNLPSSIHIISEKEEEMYKKEIDKNTTITKNNVNNNRNGITTIKRPSTNNLKSKFSTTSGNNKILNGTKKVTIISNSKLINNSINSNDSSNIKSNLNYDKYSSINLNNEKNSQQHNIPFHKRKSKTYANQQI